MYKEIWATNFHVGSTDNKPQHQNCPAGADSWCKYRRTEAEGFDMTKFRHDYLQGRHEVNTSNVFNYGRDCRLMCRGIYLI